MGSIQNYQNTIQEEEEESWIMAMQLASTASISMTLKAAIELGLLEIMAESGPEEQLSPDEIASRLPTKNPSASVVLDRMLMFLASHSVLNCTSVTDHDGRVQRRYGLGPACRFLTRNKDGVSLAAMVLMHQDKILLESWQCLKDAVLEGVIPFNKAHGMSAFDYHGTDPRFNKVFNQGMSNHTTIVMKKILDTYRGFEGLEELVDVGGGVGATLSMIISKYPHIKATNFDLPHVISEAPAFPGVEHVGGDMFVGIPSGKTIFMKWILHDWSDEHCSKILKNCWKALPNSGKVIVVESFLPESPETDAAGQNIFFGDLCMLTFNPGGKERTKREFQSLAKEAGFSSVKAVCCVFNIWVMEFTK